MSEPFRHCVEPRCTLNRGHSGPHIDILGMRSMLGAGGGEDYIKIPVAAAKAVLDWPYPVPLSFLPLLDAIKEDPSTMDRYVRADEGDVVIPAAVAKAYADWHDSDSKAAPPISIYNAIKAQL